MIAQQKLSTLKKILFGITCYSSIHWEIVFVYEYCTKIYTLKREMAKEDKNAWDN